MILNETLQEALVARANLAPSVHNTQPARWHFAPDGTITLLADPARFLGVGDPQLRDAGLSCGAAIEGTALALSELGLALGGYRDLWKSSSDFKGLRIAARGIAQTGGTPDPLASAIGRRATWRGAFMAPTPEARRSIEALEGRRDDLALALSPKDIAGLARLNDDASLRFYGHSPYRRELLGWMRLSRRHPDFARDGLNLEALRLSGFEGAAAERILGRETLFRLTGALGLQRMLLGEAAKTKSATALVLFHRPEGESPVETGRIFYRLWLALAAEGLSLWPMAVLADDPETAAVLRGRFAIPQGRRLITVWRAGPAPEIAPKARLPVKELIIKG